MCVCVCVCVRVCVSVYVFTAVVLIVGVPQAVGLAVAHVARGDAEVRPALVLARAAVVLACPGVTDIIYWHPSVTSDNG